MRQHDRHQLANPGIGQYTSLITSGIEASVESYEDLIKRRDERLDRQLAFDRKLYGLDKPKKPKKVQIEPKTPVSPQKLNELLNKFKK